MSGYDEAKTGEQTITVSYEGYEETFTVEVVKAGGGTDPSDPDTSKPDTSDPETSEPDVSTPGDDETSDTPTTGDIALPIIIVASLLVLVSAAGGIVIWKRKNHMTK